MTKAIIFDLDGTLLDTLHDLADSVNHVLTNHNMKNRTVDEIRSFIGNGVPTLIARSVPESTDKDTTAECAREMTEYYKDHADIKTKPYDGINELLKILFKIVGVGYICEFGAGILNDFGSASLAEKVTLAGKIMIVILALPIIENLLKLIQGFIELI